ncbi:MAG: AmmeMemoRadiSam system protein B [Sulfurimonas sp.]|jgi:hypothetical protein
MKRNMSVAGTFYPRRAAEIKRYFEHFSKIYDENFTLPDVKSRAVIVPHAGYIYSGYTANIAYRVLQKSGVKKFVVIGPSHKVAFNGISLCEFSSYDTPFGKINAIADLAPKLRDKFSISCIKDAHAEHSTEVQFPFLKHYIEDVSILELVYSYANAHYVSEIIDFILEHNDAGVIISTDLSHFYNLNEAHRLDNICLISIEKLDVGMLHSGCEACGNIGVEAMLHSAKKLSLKAHILDYRTSADASNDTSRVVGYTSAYFS